MFSLQILFFNGNNILSLDRFVVCSGTRLCSPNVSLADRFDRPAELRLSGRKRNRKREEKKETVKEMGFMLREIRNWPRQRRPLVSFCFFFNFAYYSFNGLYVSR